MEKKGDAGRRDRKNFGPVESFVCRLLISEIHSVSGKTARRIEKAQMLHLKLIEIKYANAP